MPVSKDWLDSTIFDTYCPWRYSQFQHTEGLAGGDWSLFNPLASWSRQERASLYGTNDVAAGRPDMGKMFAAQLCQAIFFVQVKGCAGRRLCLMQSCSPTAFQVVQLLSYRVFFCCHMSFCAVRLQAIGFQCVPIHLRRESNALALHSSCHSRMVHENVPW